MSNMPLVICTQIWLIHNKAPNHFSKITREYVNNNYIKGWIYREKPLEPIDLIITYNTIQGNWIVDTQSVNVQSLSVYSMALNKK